MKDEQIHKDLEEIINEYLVGKRSQQFVLSFISELPNNSPVKDEIEELAAVDFFQERKMREIFIRMLEKLEMESR